MHDDRQGYGHLASRDIAAHISIHGDISAGLKLKATLLVLIVESDDSPDVSMSRSMTLSCMIIVSDGELTIIRFFLFEIII